MVIVSAGYPLFDIKKNNVEFKDITRFFKIVKNHTDSTVCIQQLF